MAAIAFLRGHAIIYKEDRWIYMDTSEHVDSTDRVCIKCHLEPTVDGHDACIANLPGVEFACCGHGVEQGYIKTTSGVVREFAPDSETAIRRLAEELAKGADM